MKKILILLIVVHLVILWSDQLTEKQAELEKLNKELETMDNFLEKTQSEKAAKEARIDKMQRQKRELEAAICKLDESKCLAEKEWNKTRENLQNTASALQSQKQTEQELYNSAHELGSAFVASTCSSLGKSIADSWLLALSLEAAGMELRAVNADIINLETERLSLEKKEAADARHLEKVQKTRQDKTKTKNSYDTELKDLDRQVNTLDEEYANAMSRKKELEAARSAMNDLISELQKSSISFRPNYSYKFSSEQLIWPLKGQVVRGYGDYQGENRRITLHNDGIDIAAAIGTEVKSVDKGVVVFCTRQGASGRVVIIDHQNGYYTIYSHNDELLVSLGDTVEKGTVIALSGNSGMVEEAGLHFEIRRDGKAVDPLLYLED